MKSWPPAGGRSLVALRLDTGRTHQIRVHLAHLGCPLVGDFLYGGGDGGAPRSVCPPLSGHLAAPAHHRGGDCAAVPLPEALAGLLGAR